MIYKIPGNITAVKSPWARFELDPMEKLADWQTESNFCTKLKTQNDSKFILDAVDVSIFDFLIQNGDRHHVSGVLR